LQKRQEDGEKRRQNKERTQTKLKWTTTMANPVFRCERCLNGQQQNDSSVKCNNSSR
jgi:hypothetical protein